MDGLPSDWRVVEPPAPAPLKAPGSKPPTSDANRLWLAVLGVGVAGLIGSTAWMLSGPGQPDVSLQVAAVEVAGTGTPSGSAPNAAPELVVDVGGAVRRPGVYRLPGGARVVDAIDAAGGFAPSVDAAAAARDLNLAAPLADGDRVRVPVRGAGGADAARPSPSTASDEPAPDGLVDLNRATAAELEALPAIGEATAAKIIAAREEQPFTSVDELRSRGILGESAFGRVRSLVTVR